MPKLAWRLLRAARLRELRPGTLQPAIDRAPELEERARCLAEQRRDDRGAVEELVALAQGDRRSLGLALLLASDRDSHHAERVANLTHRLLAAALKDSEVENTVPQDAERIAAIDAFDTLPVADRWARLKSLNPELAELEVDARNGRFGDIRKIRASRVGRVRPTECPDMDQRMRLHLRLDELTGPDSPAGNDELARSRSALSTAASYLEQLSDEYWERIPQA